MATKDSLILKQARETLRQAEALVAHLEANNLEEPNFTASSPETPVDVEYERIASLLSDAAQDLVLLARGPMKSVLATILSHHDVAAWQVALGFDYFNIIPINGTMKVKDIAAAANMDVDRTRRILQLLASRRCFNEPEPDVFEQTAMSVLIAQDDDIRATIHFQMDEIFEAASMLAESIKKTPLTSDKQNCALTLRFNDTLYEYYKKNPARGTRFARAMAGYIKMNRDVATLADNFPWQQLSKKTVVDVGGGSGHTSMYLAKEYPNLTFIVEDVDEQMLAQGPKRPEFNQIQDRVSFLQHDFLKPQPVKDVAVFLIRQVTHNLTDEVLVELFRVLAAAMQDSGPGCIMLINEIILPEPNTIPRVEEHKSRQLDIAMLITLGAKQRTMKEIAALLQEAHASLVITKTYSLGVTGLIEIQLC